MARVRAILAALGTATRRNEKSFGSFSSNNLYYVGFGLAFVGDPAAFVFFLVIIGIVLFFPLATDPLRKIPRERLAVWPLINREHLLLRMVSPWLNPLTWLLAILLIWKHASAGLWMLLAGLFAIGLVAPRLRLGGHLGVWRWMPNLPGPLNQVIRKNLREMLSALDFYSGLVLAIPTFFFRASGLLPAEALFPLTLIVMVAISTYAQNLFGLDGEGGRTRYRLLPLAGWQILAAKDAAFLLAALILTVPLSPLGGLAAALMALAAGHQASVTQYRAQMRWRFQTSASFGSSVIQLILMILAASGTVYVSPLFLVPCAAAYTGSTWWFGRVLERQAL